MCKTLKSVIAIVIVIAIVGIPIYYFFGDEIVKYFKDVTTVENNCSISLSEVSKTTPVLLKKNSVGYYEFKMPENGSFKWNNNEEVTVLACPGVDNYFKCGESR